MGNRYGLEIRTAQPADASGLADLMREAGLPVASHLLAEQLDHLRYSHGTALLAQEWGPPSGVVVLHWYPVLEQASPIAQITMLLVGPDARRRGIGRQLLKAASQAARMAGCGALQLLAPAQGTGLAEFAAATGFAVQASCSARALRKKV